MKVLNFVQCPTRLSFLLSRPPFSVLAVVFQLELFLWDCCVFLIVFVNVVLGETKIKNFLIKSRKSKLDKVFQNSLLYIFGL